MTDILTVRYAQTGRSAAQDSMGMREMQARAYEEREAQYLLIKAPPASGKSRALMFLALDKVYKQGLKKVIVAVPEMTIGGSFADTDLTSYGFFADWKIDDGYNLCGPGDLGKVERVIEFLADPTAKFLLCTHATLRFAYDRIKLPYKFDDVLIAVDEFHHTSMEAGNVLGQMIHELMEQSKAHIIAMTGSYFRGDAVPILAEEDEAKFTQVTYTYYEQLNGYKYLKSLGIGYHFYQGRYFDALEDVLDLNKKTIIHIPNVNSIESTKQKYDEVDRIFDVIGTVTHRDPESGIFTITTRDGRELLVADLVTDDQKRADVLNYLRNIKNRDEMDIIVALGMAKEGFDWPWCEHVLTIGYRSSLTEIVQIIGRATRDCEGKTHAQFTNLIAQPMADDDDVTNSVNNMLKAITVSLLMEQILAPAINFKPRSILKVGEPIPPGTIIVDDTGASEVSKAVSEIISNGGIDNVVTSVMQDVNAVGRIITNAVTADEFSKLELPVFVQRKFPSLERDDIETIAKFVELQMKIHASGGQIDELGNLVDKQGRIIVELPAQPKTEVLRNGGDGSKSEPVETPPVTPPVDDGQGGQVDPRILNAIVEVGKKFINIENLNLDLIESVNPFKGAFEVLSKSVDAPLLKTIKSQVVANKSHVTEEEAVLLWSNVKEFVRDHRKEPSPDSNDPYEKRLGEVLAYVRMRKAQKLASQATVA